MQKITYHVATTLDGYLARADGSFDCFPSEGDHIADYLASLASYGTVLMGRRTYEVGLKVGVTDPYPPLRPYVFSRTLPEIADPRVTVVRDDTVGVVRRLKEQESKDIYLCGGGELASSLFAAGLIDEVLIKLNPVLLGGGGIPLAPGLAGHLPLALRSTKVYASGVVLLRYAVA